MQELRPQIRGRDEAPSAAWDDQARRRLSNLALGVGLVMALALGTDLVGALLGAATPRTLLGRVSSGGLIALSAALVVATRALAPSIARVRDLALVYQVVGAFFVALPVFARPEALGRYDLVHLSWVAVWICLFPLAVPASLLRHLAAGLLAASAAGFVWLTLGRTGTPLDPPASALASALAPNLVAALLAVFPAHVVQGLTAEVRRARLEARRLGSYQLVERIGQGGMGEVWRAEHALLARPAAVKLVRLDGLAPGQRRTALARFEREAQVTASLESPHVVRLHDFGVTEEGAFYTVLELLDGLDLDTLVERHGPQPPARVVHLLAQACEALAEAHHAGLVHRDVKPSNLFVARQGLRHDVVKVLDFGLVGAVEGTTPSVATDEGAKLTGRGYLVGTPAYMAPEAVLGRELDARADLYGLGCVAYVLLTGRPPFPGDDVARVLRDHALLPPPPPSAVASQPIPEALERLVLDCLEKEPRQRPASAEELRARLLRLGQELEAGWSELDAWRWWSQVAAGARRVSGSAVTDALPGVGVEQATITRAPLPRQRSLPRRAPCT